MLSTPVLHLCACTYMSNSRLFFFSLGFYSPSAGRDLAACAGFYARRETGACLHGQTEIRRLFRVKRRGKKKKQAPRMCVLALSTRNTTKDDIFLALQNYRGANKIDEVGTRRHTTASKNRGVVFVFFFFSPWVTNWASSIEPQPTWTSFPPLQLLSSPAFVLCVAFESRATLPDYRWRPSGVECSPADESQSKQACAPLSSWRVLLRQRTNEGNWFQKYRLGYSLICDFLIQEYDFLNIWSGFIVGLFFFVCFFCFLAHSDMQRAGSIGM